MKIKQGRIIIVNYPFTCHTQSKVRPALIISNDNYHNGEDIICAAISSKQGLEKFEIDLQAKHLIAGTISKASFVKCGNIMTINKKLILQTVASINNNKLKEVLQKIEQILN